MAFGQSRLLLVTGLVFAWAAAPAQATISFMFNYADSSWPAEAKASLDSAASMISSYFPVYNTTIVMEVSGTSQNNGTLASAASTHEVLAPGFTNLGVVGSKILTGIDANGADADGVVNANFFHQWSFSNIVTSLEYDFTDVMFHELSHAMGFSSLVDEDGLSAFDAFTPGAYSPFDQFLTNGSGVSLVDPLTFTTNNDWTVASVGGTGTVPASPNTGLYFNGPNASAANGGNPIPIYSPVAWESGSSGSHLDDDFFTGANQKTMNAATAFGPGVRQFSDIELGIWRDLGYTVVPEPGASLLAFIGLGTLLMRRDCSSPTRRTFLL